MFSKEEKDFIKFVLSQLSISAIDSNAEEYLSLIKSILNKIKEEENAQVS